jgi:hypothetical protein
MNEISNEIRPLWGIEAKGVAGGKIPTNVLSTFFSGFSQIDIPTNILHSFFLS